MVSVLAMGCDLRDRGAGEAGGDGDGDGAGAGAGENDERSAEEGTASVESAASMMLVTEALTVPEEGTDPDDAGEAIVAEIESELPPCSTMQTDGSTWVELTFSGCTGVYGLATLDGVVRAELDPIVGTCGPLPCVTAVAYAVTTEDLTVNDAAIHGAFDLEVPVDAAAQRSWDGELTIGLPDGGSMSYSTTATWAWSQDCIAFDLSAGVDRNVLPWSLDATGVDVCAGACPEAGDVSIETNNHTLSWSYDGSGETTVRLDDESWTVPLLCEA